MRSRPGTVDRPTGGDDGFTLIEVLVAVAIVAVVMLGLGAVFVATASGTDAQGQRQTAVRLATGGLDRTRALGAAVVTGRDQTRVANQWATMPAGVRSLVGSLPAAVDPAADGRTAPALPTDVQTSTVDGVAYTQTFYIATCALDATATCRAKAAPGTVPMFDVVVAIGWRGQGCAKSACTYEVSTLLGANTDDPTFNTQLQAVGPAVGKVADQVLDVTERVTGPAVGVSGGNGTVALSFAGLPDGIDFDPATGTFTGTAKAVTAATTVTVTATDQFRLTGQTTFTWTVNPLPKLVDATLPIVVGALTAPVDLARTLGLTGGTTGYGWACTGLPATLLLDGRTGLLTGAVTLPGLTTLACTVTDARGKTATAKLTLTTLGITSPPNGSTAAVSRTTGVNSTATATGCTLTCTWSATGLPTGVTINATTGLVSGKPALPGTYTVVFKATDAATARTATSTVTWTVR